MQHHHAHLAACLAEHGETGPAVGAIYDGAGLGTDGTVWGGELLVGGLDGCERAGHLWPVRLPGGDAAVREPWRMACAWLHALGDDDPPSRRRSPERCRDRAGRRSARSCGAAPRRPSTTSAGRLFDAVAALCGIRAAINYEGQAAAELEAACDPDERGAYPLPVGRRATADRARRARDDRARSSTTSPAGVAAGASQPASTARWRDGDRAGCALAARAQRARDGRALGRRVPEPRPARAHRRRSWPRPACACWSRARLPPNDGGIAFGQAAVAAAGGAASTT